MASRILPSSRIYCDTRASTHTRAYLVHKGFEAPSLVKEIQAPADLVARKVLKTHTVRASQGSR